MKKKLKIKCLGSQNSNQHQNCIFGGFRLRGIFFVCDQKVDKIFQILDFLTFEGIAESCGRPGFGRISMSNFQFEMVCLGACENKYFSLHLIFGFSKFHTEPSCNTLTLLLLSSSYLVHIRVQICVFPARNRLGVWVWESWQKLKYFIVHPIILVYLVIFIIL